MEALDMSAYDDFGADLEKAVDIALKNDEFLYSLIKETQKQTQGDYETLMTTLLDVERKEEGTVKDILLESAEGLFTETALDEFLGNHPSLIIATRGNILSWLEQTHVAPVVFIPSDFDEKQKEIEVLQEGKKVNLKIDKIQNLHLVLRLYLMILP